MKITVASLNPVKIRAVEQSVSELWPNITPNIQGIKVPSEVSDQPMSDAETRKGAHKRVQNAMKQGTQVDYWVGIEAGVEDWGDKMGAFAWVVIANRDRVGEARSATFFLPKKVAQLIRSGMELGEADDIVFGSIHSKYNDGAIGLLTHNAITRETLYIHPVIMAFIPFIRGEFY